MNIEVFQEIVHTLGMDEVKSPPSAMEILFDRDRKLGYMNHSGRFMPLKTGDFESFHWGEREVYRITPGQSVEVYQHVIFHARHQAFEVSDEYFFKRKVMADHLVFQDLNLKNKFLSKELILLDPIPESRTLFYLDDDPIETYWLLSNDNLVGPKTKSEIGDSVLYPVPYRTGLRFKGKSPLAISLYGEITGAGSTDINAFL